MGSRLTRSVHRAVSRPGGGSAGILSLALLLTIPAYPLVSAGPTPHATALSQTWAYGGNRSLSSTAALRGGSISISERAGYVVVLTQQTAASGTVTLGFHRAMGTVLTVQYCSPNCANSQVRGSVEFHAFELLDGYANLTPAGSVESNGSSVPALAVLNASTTVRSGLYDNDSLTAIGSTPPRGGVSNLSISISAAFRVAFSPSLGLIPVSVTPGESWSSTSSYVAAGSWSANFASHRANLAGLSIDRTGNPNGSLDANGSVSLQGAAVAPVTLSDGARTEGLGLALTGGLLLREGFVFLPSLSDLFGGSPRSDLPQGNGSVSESFGELDLGSAPGAHVGFLASSANYVPSGAPIASATAVGAVPAASPDSPVLVQAEPESVPSTGTQGCTTYGDCGPESPAGEPSRGIAPGILVTGLAAVGLGVATAAVLVTRRPRVPPRPNSALYPPVVNREADEEKTAGRKSAHTMSAATAEAAEEDPLAHLW